MVYQRRRRVHLPIYVGHLRWHARHLRHLSYKRLTNAAAAAGIRWVASDIPDCVFLAALTKSMRLYGNYIDSAAPHSLYSFAANKFSQNKVNKRCRLRLFSRRGLCIWNGGNARPEKANTLSFRNCWEKLPWWRPEWVMTPGHRCVCVCWSVGTNQFVVYFGHVH